MARLPHAYFEPPKLSATDRQSFVNNAKDACRNLVRQARAMDMFPIYCESTHHRTQRRLSMRLGHDVGNPRLVCMSAHTQVSCTVDAIADLYYTNTVQHTYEHVLHPSVLDRRCLYPLVHRDQVAPLHYVALNWMAVEMPSVIADRDFCYVEYHDEFHDGADRRGWARAIHSVDLASCPPLHDKFGMIRGKIYHSGQVFIENDGNSSVLDMHQIVCVELHGTVSHDIHHAVLVQLAEECMNVDEYLRTVNLSQCRLVDAMASKAHCCACCEAPFKVSLLFASVKRHLCRVCGHTVCEECSALWDLDCKKPVRVCIACSEQAKDPLNLSLSKTLPLMTAAASHAESPAAALDRVHSAHHQRHDQDDHGSMRATRSRRQSGQRQHSNSAPKIVLFDEYDAEHGLRQLESTSLDENAADRDSCNQKLRDLLETSRSYNPDAVRQIVAALE
ncbi:hypothetical protein DYB32_005794 [Aphanomyces invadans]|uniref:FYVE-type domain-containing protein n=1 Tax=Aphanomyces invadans TaxID=157072 RepID=A0A3R7A7R3_9STRA|nr:hypothetical protein DYB32_005794 [Aphanomyces invadans]